jgi:hypothetical protein
LRSSPARNPVLLPLEIQRAKGRFGPPDYAPVVSCYEAGRDGSWLHRWLIDQGIHNHVVDAASIETGGHFVTTRGPCGRGDRGQRRGHIRM